MVHVTYEGRWYLAKVESEQRRSRNEDAPVGHRCQNHVRLRWADGLKSSVDLRIDNLVATASANVGSATGHASDFTPLWWSTRLSPTPAPPPSPLAPRVYQRKQASPRRANR